MKKILIFLLIFSISTVCYAEIYGRVCVIKSTGQFLEFQSGEAPLGTLTQNVLNWGMGYKKEDLEEKYITLEEWKAIREEWIEKPIREKIAKEEKDKKAKKEAIKEKLNLSEKDWQDLKSALK